MSKKPITAGRFITLEGIEGVGKSTHLKFIQQYLRTHKIAFIATREPGGTPIAEEIRKILLTPHEENITAISELLLLFAGRAQHLEHVIKPALAANKWVICDRFTDTSYAYQGYGRGMPLSQITTLEKWVQNGVHPDPILFFDAPVEVALKRASKRCGNPDRIEAEQADFFQRAREGYLARAKEFPERYKIIDANKSLEKVQHQIKIILDKLIV